MVTFDKGSRVPRLEAGATLDARQVGILLAQVPLPGEPAANRRIRILKWNRDRSVHATLRIQAAISEKGGTHRQTLLLALSLDVLSAFAVDDAELGLTLDIEGSRGGGYKVVRTAPYSANP